MCVALFAVTLPAQAQDTPTAEIFGGYSYLNSSPGDPTGIADRLNMHGWNGSFAGNFNYWFGIVGDFSGHYTSDCVDVLVVDISCDHHSFAAGPEVSFRGTRTRAFVRALFGVDNASVEAGALGFTTSTSDNSFLFGGGGGVDIRANDSISIRAVQFDYLTTDHFSDLGADRQHHFRISAGVVITLARR
jgi:hypothetical protein